MSRTETRSERGGELSLLFLKPCIFPWEAERNACIVKKEEEEEEEQKKEENGRWLEAARLRVSSR